MSGPTQELTIVGRAAQHAGRPAVVAAEGRFSYGDLISASHAVASALLEGRADLGQARVAYLVPPGFHWVATQWGIWRAGGVAVPLAVSHPPPEHEYVIRDCGAAIVLAHPDHVDTLAPVA